MRDFKVGQNKLKLDIDANPTVFLRPLRSWVSSHSRPLALSSPADRTNVKGICAQ